MAFNFTGFDGNSYSLPDLPNDLLYNYFVLFKANYSSGSAYTLVVFNDKLQITKNSTSYLISTDITGDISSPKQNVFECSSSSKDKFSIYYVNNPYELSISKNSVIYCSESLIKFKDEILSGNISIEMSKETNNFVLVPIFETQPNIYKNVFNEVFSLLPVCLIVLVGFIGIRKGINWLFSFLKKS